MRSELAQVRPTERLETQLELARWSSDIGLLVGVLLSAVAIYAIVWLYRRESRGQLSRRMRWTLAGLRVALLGLLGFIGLEPVIVNYVHRRIDAYTLVLVDESASMSLADAYRLPEDARRAEAVLGGDSPEAVNRADLEERLLTDRESGLLPRLARRNKLVVAKFSDVLRPIGAFPSATSAPAGDGNVAPVDWTAISEAGLEINPAGSATDVGMAVRGAIDGVGGAPIAGVVLLSDGGFNRGESPAVIAQMLKARGVPLYAVGVGDPSEPLNVVVTEVAGPRSAFKNDPFSVTVRLEARNLENQSLSVELLERSAGTAGTPQPVDRRTVRVNEDGTVEPVVFERKIARPGAMSYVARVAPVEHEAIAADNEKEILPAVQILDDKMRVLLVAGSPVYDYRFLARMLERDATVDVSTWLQSADMNSVRDGNTIITELPEKQEELFKYDAVILIDPDPEQLDPAWGSLLAAFVSDHGGGLLYGAGNKFAGRFFRSPNTASIVEMLPVVPEPDAEIMLNELGQYQTRAWPIEIPDAALGDSILRQADNLAENRAVWSALDGVYWHFPVRREKPVAVTLMRHSNPRMVSSFGPHVLLATQFVGSGRCVYLGLNSTWRWRKHDEKYFNRFWIQMTRYLVEGRLLGGRSRGMILTPKDQFDLGESVPVTVRALDERFDPLLVPELELVAASTSGSDDSGEPRQPLRVTLTPVVGREGYYQGRFIPLQAGTIHLSVTLPGLPTGPGPSPVLERDLTINRPAIEMRNTAMNRAALEQLALGSGGRYFDVDEAPRIAELIPDSSRTLVSRERPRPLWDNAYVLVLLAVIVTLEWALRRKARLL
ncbi:MAG: hypothetical protein DCC65_03895 [Planctomycetota bacterium]|nr:MAG: hypothetical protein DCC65_03895 [Planctomycetota bacterium]